MMEEQQKHPEASGSLTLLLTSLATACKATEAAVRKAGTKISILALSGMIDPCTCLLHRAVCNHHIISIIYSYQLVLYIVIN